MDYLYTHHIVTIHSHKSDMALSLVSDAAILSFPMQEAAVSPYTHCTTTPTSNPPIIKPNGPVHVLVKTIGGVPYSLSEDETGGILLGTQEAVLIIHAITELGHTWDSR